MDAAPSLELRPRGACLLAAHLSGLDRATTLDRPTGRTRLHRALGADLADSLVAALARTGWPRPGAPI